MTNPLAKDLGGVVRLLEKATPGPWECGAGKAYEPQTTVYCDDTLGSAVATCAHSMTALIPTEQERANAAAIAAAVNFLRTHSAEIAGALRDAERFDWMAHHGASLRNEPGEGWFVLAPYHTGIPSVDGRIRFPTARAAIDSAMQQGGGGGDHA